jgi:hypothetical protein
MLGYESGRKEVKMDIVKSLDEAMSWFLSHSSFSVKCIDGEREKVCNCYPEAKGFYESK